MGCFHCKPATNGFGSCLPVPAIALDQPNTKADGKAVHQHLADILRPYHVLRKVLRLQTDGKDLLPRLKEYRLLVDSSPHLGQFSRLRGHLLRFGICLCAKEKALGASGTGKMHLYQCRCHRHVGIEYFFGLVGIAFTDSGDLEASDGGQEKGLGYRGFRNWPHVSVYPTAYEA